MTDLEMTRLCAEAMGIHYDRDIDTAFVGNPIQATVKMYNPLHNDAQAMALVKKFGITIQQVEHWDDGLLWQAFTKTGYAPKHKDLNRAIVECVAKMQAAKK